MSIFSFWHASKSQDAQSEASIRESARLLVEAGVITLATAREAAEQRRVFETKSQGEQVQTVKVFKELGTLANVNRNGFKYDKHNLCQADAFVVDELCRLVDEFDKSPVSPMGAAALEVEIDRLAVEMNTRMDQLRALKPGPTTSPTPAATEQMQLAEITRQAESDYRTNKHDCHLRFNSEKHLVAARRYAFKNPEMDFHP